MNRNKSDTHITHAWAKNNYSSPRPEAREEDIIDALIHDLEYAIPDDYEGSAEYQERRRGIVRAALSRLAAPKPEGQEANHPGRPDCWEPAAPAPGTKGEA